MDVKEFASAYGEAFGPAAGLPLLFWYSDGPVRAVPKVEGCFFKALAEAREGSAVSLNAANIGCGGGKFYTGFAPMPPFVPAFVSQKEHYKQTPEMVLEFIGGSACRRPPVRGSILRALIRRRPRRLSVRPTGCCFSPRPTYCRDWCRGPFTTTMPTMPCARPSGRDAAPS